MPAGVYTAGFKYPAVGFYTSDSKRPTGVYTAGF